MSYEIDSHILSVQPAVEREARTWGNRYAVLSETTADVRHVHSGECSMVKQRAERVQGLRRAIGEVERVVKELGGTCQGRVRTARSHL